MTQPYRYAPYTVRYETSSDEAALVVRRTQRRAGLSTISGKPRSIYGAKKTPFADDLVQSIYGMHLEEISRDHALSTPDGASPCALNGETCSDTTSLTSATGAA